MTSNQGAAHHGRLRLQLIKISVAAAVALGHRCHRRRRRCGRTRRRQAASCRRRCTAASRRRILRCHKRFLAVAQPAVSADQVGLRQGRRVDPWPVVCCRGTQQRGSRRGACGAVGAVGSEARCVRMFVLDGVLV